MNEQMAHTNIPFHRTIAPTYPKKQVSFYLLCQEYFLDNYQHFTVYYLAFCLSVSMFIFLHVQKYLCL